MQSSIFQITKKGYVTISLLKVYLKFNEKVVIITLKTHGKPSV